MGKVRVSFLLFLSLMLTACSASSTQAPATPNPTLASMNTAAIQTVAMKLLLLTLTPEAVFRPADATLTMPPPTQGDLTAPPTPQEASAPAPTTTPALQPSPASPCNRADFIGDVTIPDGSVLPPGFTFTKTWRLRNSGSCTWSKAYHVIYVQGTPLGSSGEFPLQAEVPPGAEAQISLSLQAPLHAGLAETLWKIRSPDGEVFGTGENSEDPLWVKISVEGTQEEIQEQPQNPPGDATPDDATPIPARCSPLGDPSFERKLYTLINAERTKRNLFLYIFSPQLTELARAHSRDMAIYDYVDHVNSDGDGLAERLKKQHISSAVFSESLFNKEQIADLTPEQVEESWIYKEADQTNIFNVTFSQIGIGYMVCNADPKEVYVTAVFSQPN